MMSATPDPRVMNIFKHVEMLELPDSVLFPILVNPSLMQN